MTDKDAPTTRTVYDAWWTINGRDLLAALGRAQSGEDPEMIYAELYANSDHEDFR